MKAFFKLLIIGLAASVLISPALVGWKIWQCHRDFVTAQRALFSDYHPVSDTVDAPNFEFSSIDSGEFPSIASMKQPFVSSTLITSAFLGLSVSMPLGFYAGRRLSDRQQSRRLTLSQQVARLEKIWQQSIS